MILSTRGRAAGPIGQPIIGRITMAHVGADERSEYVLVGGPDVVGEAEGYAAVLSEGSLDEPPLVPTVHSARLGHLSAGDVVSIDSTGYVRTLYRRDSPHNWIFATDRCNSLCLMCSQPPRDVDESGIVERHLRLISLIDPLTKDLGISGGEPTLLGAGLIRIVRECRDRLPNTALHILSNGRLFEESAFAKALGDAAHPNLMVGIPIYSDIDAEHDYVVQSEGAFKESIRGICNLGLNGVPVEIRVVIHRATYQRLPQLAEFLYRNLTFAAQIVFMGLEITGFTIPNLASLWIDSADYQSQLRSATLFLARRGVPVWIYNHQLCVLPKELWSYSRRSISDWKNEFLPTCAKCIVQDRCGGFFASAVSRHRTSRGISPIFND